MEMRKTRQRRSRGSGTIRKTGANKYSVGADVPRTTPDAKRRTKYATVIGTMEDARKRLRALQLQVSNDAFIDDDKLLVNDLLDRYLQAKAISKEATTCEWYRRHFAQHIRPVIGNQRLGDLRATHIQALLGNARNQSRTMKRGDPLNATSLRNLLVGIRAALAWGVRQGLLIRNVADLVESPALPHVERAVVGLENVRAILAASDGSELEAVVPFALGTGLRRSEICALRWADVDFGAGTVRVQRAAANVGGKVIIKATKTKRSRRTEFLAPFVIEILRKHRLAQAERHLALGIENRRPEGYIFDRADGRPWDPNEMSRKFSRLVRKHKLLAIRLHDLRHGYASLSFAAGVPLRVVSESLGHSSIGITASVYVHLVDQTKRDAADAFEAYLAPALTHRSDALAVE